jgi:hypothetical protein
MTNRITIQAAPNRLVVFPDGYDLRLRGAHDAIPKYGIEATPADPAVTIVYSDIVDPQLREKIRQFIRGRLRANDLEEPKQALAAAADAPAPSSPPLAPPPRPSPKDKE